MTTWRVNWAVRYAGRIGWDSRSNIIEAPDGWTDKAVAEHFRDVTLQRERRAGTVKTGDEFRINSVSRRCAHVATRLDGSGEPHLKPCHQFTGHESGWCAKHREEVQP